jgi:hypothetical protein
MVTMKAQVEPVGHVDVRLLALQERAHEHSRISDPDDRQPQVHIPFGLGVFRPWVDAQQVAGRRHHDEQLVAPEHEPGEVAAPHARARGALHDVERLVAISALPPKAKITAEVCSGTQPPEIQRKAQELEENEVFPLLMKLTLGNPQLSATLERLEREHCEDECYGEEIAALLEECAHNGQPANPESAGYMLRGFFTGLRRHVAFERECLMTLAANS